MTESYARDLRERVPTVPDLHAEGMAIAVEWTETKKERRPIRFRLTPEGQQLIYDAMARNARLALTDPTQAPHRLVFGSHP